jgi:hypothetical protein
VLPQAAHAREVVLELRELDLELPLRATRVLGEDVQDQLGAIDDASLESVLEGALLRRAQLLVDEEHFRLRASVSLLELGELPLADERARIGARAMLDELAHWRDARGTCELTQLSELGLPVDAARKHSDDEAALRLRPWDGIGLAHGHDWIMPR